MQQKLGLDHVNVSEDKAQLYDMDDAKNVLDYATASIRETKLDHVDAMGARAQLYQCVYMIGMMRER